MLTLKITDDKIPMKLVRAVRSVVADAENFNPSDVSRLAYVRRELAKKLDLEGGRFAAVESRYAVTVHRLNAVGENIGLPLATVERPETDEELLAEYASTRESVVRDWKRVYEQGRRAVAGFVEKSKIDQQMYEPGALVYQVKWGVAVEEDLAAEHASKILAAIDDGHPVERVLTWTVEQLTRDLTGGAYRPTSTSAFSNAVDIVRSSVAQTIIEKCRTGLDWLAVARANCEVL